MQVCPCLCEKPIDLDIARVDALRAKAAASDVPIALGFNKRFDRHFVELKRRVAADEIGSVGAAGDHKSRPGGAAGIVS